MKVDGISAAKRRRQRRVRSWWRHEQQTVAAVLATFQHHSAPRGQKKARTGEEDHEMNNTATIRTHAPLQSELCSLREEPAGTPPEALAELRPQAREVRHLGSETLLASGPDSRRSHAADGGLYPCCAGAGERSASSRSSCRGAYGSCSGPA